jgi:hypothetical protein
LAARFSNHTLHSIKGEVKRKLEFLFTSSQVKSGTKRKSLDSNRPSGSKKRKVSQKSSKAKGKMKSMDPDNQDDFGDEDEPAHLSSDQVELEDISFLSDNEVRAPSHKKFDKNIPDDDDIYESIDLSNDNDDNTNDYDWSHSLLEEPGPRFKPYSKNQPKASNRSTMNIIQEGDNEVIMLSSD